MNEKMIETLQLYLNSLQVWMLATKICESGTYFEVWYKPTPPVFQRGSRMCALNQLYFAAVKALLGKGGLCRHLTWHDVGQNCSIRFCLPKNFFDPSTLNCDTAEIKRVASCLREAVAVVDHIKANRSSCVGLLECIADLTLAGRFCFVNMEEKLWYAGVFVAPQELGERWWADETTKAVVNRLTKRTAARILSNVSGVVHASKALQEYAHKCLETYANEEQDKLLGFAQVSFATALDDSDPSPRSIMGPGLDSPCSRTALSLMDLPVHFAVVENSRLGCAMIVMEATANSRNHDTGEYGLLGALVLKEAAEYVINEWYENTATECAGEGDEVDDLVLEMHHGAGGTIGTKDACFQCEETEMQLRRWETRGASVVHGSHGFGSCPCQRVSTSTVFRLNGKRTYVRSSPLYPLPSENGGAEKQDVMHSSMHGLKTLLV